MFYNLLVRKEAGKNDIYMMNSLLILSRRFESQVIILAAVKRERKWAGNGAFKVWNMFNVVNVFVHVKNSDSM